MPIESVGIYRLQQNLQRMLPLIRGSTTTWTYALVDINPLWGYTHPSILKDEKQKEYNTNRSTFLLTKYKRAELTRREPNFHFAKQSRQRQGKMKRNRHHW